MEQQITLQAESVEALNKLIDIELKAGYLIHGEMSTEEKNKFSQVMIQPNNIDGEVSSKGLIKIIVGGIIYGFLVYYLF